MLSFRNISELLEVSSRLAQSVAGRLYLLATGHKVDNRYFQDAQYHPLYEHATKAAQALAVHYTPGTSAGHLISEIRPYEAPELRDYRTKIYQPVTQSYAAKILNLQRSNLFDNKQFYLEKSASTPIAGEEGLYEYVTKLMPGVSDIRKYFQDTVLAQAQRDVNAFYVVMPYRSDAEHLETFGEAAPDQYRKPVPGFVPSSHVLDYGSNYLLAKSDEEFYIEGKTCFSLFLFTDDYIIYLQPVSIENAAVNYIPEVYHFHGLSYADTARQVGGTISHAKKSVLTRSKAVLYESPLSPSLPFFNTAVQELSDLRAAIITHLHPQRYEAAMACDDCNGRGKNFEGEICNTCGGSGQIASTTTMHAITVEPNENGEINAPAGYVMFNTDIITKAWEWYKYNIEEAFSALSMDFLFRRDGNAGETARAKEIDREELHNHFRKVAGLIFPLLQWMLDAINLQRYSVILGNEVYDNRVIVHYPESFDTTKPNESLERFDLSKKAGADIAYTVELAKEMYAKTLGTNSDAYKRSVLALQLDPIPGAGTDDIMGMQALDAGFSSEDIQYRSRITAMIGEAERREPGFLELQFEDQKAIIDRIFAEIQVSESADMEDMQPPSESIETIDVIEDETGDFE